ncbi:MAG TPA: KH domain-containing protein [Candidatus Sulfotelmatobacter sp.]|nr:KH domain-containing protein [Candidatus Sulfotelmatobacter sp.]
MTDYADLTRFIIEKIVDDREAMDVTMQSRGRTAVVEVTVSPQDAGKVIGRGGRNVDAIRAVVRAAGLRRHERVQVEVTRRGDERSHG